MPDLKISQLSAGGAAQAADEFPIARSGGNAKITGANIAAAATSVGTLSSLTVSGNVTVDTNTLFVDATNDRVGIGTVTPGCALHVERASNDNVIAAVGQSGYEGALYISGAGSGKDAAIVVGNNRTLYFRTTSSTTPTVSGTNLMALTSAGNLGIGTTAPIAQLSNSSTSDSITGTQPTGFVWRSTDNDWASAIISRPSSGLSYGLRVHTGGATASDYPLWVSSGAGTGTQLFAINGAGNLGLGVTPSAWESTCRMLQLGAVATVGRANSGETQLGFNYFINTSGQYIYIQSLNATRYEQTGGQHRWYTAASGTAGAAISFTQAMTLDASGNLLVGPTSAVGGAKAAIAGTIISNTNTASTFSGAYGGFDWVSSRSLRIFSGSADATNSQIEFYAGVSGGISERFRIKGPGQVRFLPLAAAPTTNVEDGDVYYDSGTNKLRVRAGGAWTDLH